LLLDWVRATAGLLLVTAEKLLVRLPAAARRLLHCEKDALNMMSARLCKMERARCNCLFLHGMQGNDADCNNEAGGMIRVPSALQPLDHQTHIFSL
jgi:hypothetical protein